MVQVEVVGAGSRFDDVKLTSFLLGYEAFTEELEGILGAH